MRWIGVVLVAVFCFLQYELWAGKGGIVDIIKRKQQLEEQRKLLKATNNQNAKLYANIKDLRNGHQALEGEARSELGMIKKGEVYYQVVKS